MTPEETQALALAQWLEANPGTQPPADVDADVLEAVYALRPDLAPAPSLTVEQILAGVAAGPLLAPAPQPLVHSAQAPAPANDPQPRGWLPWALGGASALAAAAIALIIVVPTVFGPGADGLNADVAAMAPAQESAEPAEFRRQAASAPEGRSAAPPTDGMEPEEKNEQLRDRASSEPGPIGGEQLAQQPAADSASPAPLATVEPTSRTAVAARPRTTQAQETSARIGGVISADEDAVADLGEEMDLEEADAFDFASNEPAKADPEVAGADVSGGAPSLDDLESATEEVGAIRGDDSVVRAESLSKLGGRASKSKDKREESEAPQASSDDTFVVPDSQRTTDLTTLERRARPTGPVAAETEAVSGLISAGKLADARDSAQRMLNAGGLNNARRADLNWALGRALQGLGKESQARSAYRRAIELRQ